MEQWEYLMVEVNLHSVTVTASTERINNLGEQGWELVATVPNEYGSSAWLIFKRPKS